MTDENKVEDLEAKELINMYKNVSFKALLQTLNAVDHSLKIREKSSYKKAVEHIRELEKENKKIRKVGRRIIKKLDRQIDRRNVDIHFNNIIGQQRNLVTLQMENRILELEREVRELTKVIEIDDKRQSALISRIKELEAKLL